MPRTSTSSLFRHYYDGAIVLTKWLTHQCPHDGECPIHRAASSTMPTCHFGQKVQRPAFLRKTKHSGKGEEIANFSYVILKRGPRPPSGAATTEVGDALENDNELRQMSMDWPRLVLPPMKRKGHVVTDLCSPAGTLLCCRCMPLDSC